ncbi:MAG: hypothetical protein C0430_03525 [Flavobacterium sp.]|nr:hypothetical protein [Flavobacterium sp.]
MILICILGKEFISDAKVDRDVCNYFIQITFLFTTFTDFALNLPKGRLGLLNLYCNSKRYGTS